MKRFRNPSVAILAVWFFCAGCSPQFAFSAPARNESKDLLIHLPGISGEMFCDRQMLRGLREGGFDGTIEVVDWTQDDPGLNALFAQKRNRERAQALADKIQERRRQEPEGRIILSGHSGGSGIAIWALERLPDDVLVDAVLLLAPALSPTFDLSDALRHVKGNIYAFTSPNDAIVLGLGTRLFRTIDGKKVEAAGRVGFTRPESGDLLLYKRLVPMPYDKAWMKLGNIGDHIGVMSKKFAAKMLAPLVLDAKRAPPPEAAPQEAPKDQPAEADQAR